MNSFKVMIGVIPGYNHENKDLTASNAYQIGEEEWKKSIEEISNTQSNPENPESPNFYSINAQIIPALAVYSKNFGCPVGGEVGIQIEGQMEENQDEELYRNSVIETLKIAMQNLGQNTATIEWAQNEKSQGTTYLSEGGKESNDNDSLDGIEHFSVSLGNGTTSNEEYVRVGNTIQDAMELISKTNTGKPDENYYMISGILTPDKNSSSIQFSASQNPIYGQSDKKLYKESVIRTISETMKTLHQEKTVIHFDNEDIVLNLEKILEQESEKKNTEELI